MVNEKHSKMGKITAFVAVIVLSLFTFLWYNEYIQSVSVHTMLCSGFSSRTNVYETESGSSCKSMNLEDRNAENVTEILRLPDDKIIEDITRYLKLKGKILTTENTYERNNITKEEIISSTTKELITLSTFTYRSLVATVEYTIQAKIEPIEMEPITGNKHIIFIETRCLLHESQSKDKGLSLKERQACAIESAARMNPDYKIYLLYTCPMNGALEDSSQHVKSIFTYSNVKLWKVNASQHFLNTPLSDWDLEAAINSSEWPHEHSSDVLRFLTLWKYGGTYLDLDVMILKSLSELGTNYVGVENEHTIASSVLSFSSDGVGHEVAEHCVDEILNNFRGNIWAYNGPLLITRVLLKMCNSDRVSDLSAEKCSGFKILSSKKFFPVPHTKWELFFDERNSDILMSYIEDSYGIHVWNMLTKTTNVEVGSQQLYALIAGKACPEVYSTVRRVF